MLTEMSTGPELCRAADTGGGVEMNGTFLIYSVATIPIIPDVAPALRLRLESQVHQITSLLPIYLDRSSLDVESLVSLPAPALPPNTQMIDRLPWFYIHAATIGNHAIVGDAKAVDTLLRILSRPWCILELCYSSKETLSALLNFALVASELDPKIYAPTIQLIEHELKARDAPAEARYLADPPLSIMEDLRSKLFLPSENSYNSVWLRIIFTCALQLNIPLSELGRLLDNDLSTSGDSIEDIADRLRQLSGQINGHRKIESSVPAPRPIRTSSSMTNIQQSLATIISAKKKANIESVLPSSSDEPLYNSFIQLYCRYLTQLSLLSS